MSLAFGKEGLEKCFIVCTIIICVFRFLLWLILLIQQLHIFTMRLYCSSKFWKSNLKCPQFLTSGFGHFEKGSLEEAGLYLGEVNQRNKHNKKGNNESLFLMNLHEAILEKSGGSWSSPLVDVKWSLEDKDALIKYIHTYAGQEVWGFKDPRTMFLIDEWIAQIPQLQMVGIYRHPLSVARSLQVRNRFKIQRGLNLWKIYNRRLLELHKIYNFPIIEFTAKPLKLENQLKTVVNILGLEPRESFSFFFKKLVHNHPDNTDLPYEVLQVYRRLKRFSL